VVDSIVLLAVVVLRVDKIPVEAAPDLQPKLASNRKGP